MSLRKPLQMGIPSTMNDDYQLTLKHYFDHGLTIQPNEKMITKCDNNQSHTMTNGEFKAIQPQLASALSSVGFGVGDIAASFMWNTPRHLSLYYTVPNMGGCLLPVNIRLHPKEITFILNHSQPKIMFIDASLLPLYERIPAKAFQSVQYFIICGSNMKSGGWSIKAPHISPVMDYDQFIAQNGRHKQYIWPNLSHKSGAFLLYTSGTTGNPKGIIYSHRSIYLGVLSFSIYEPYDTVLMLHPFFHAAGGFMPFGLMTYGFRSLFPNNCYDFGELLQFSLQEGATQMMGVPTMIMGLSNALKQNPKKYEAFRGKLKFSTGGSAVPASLVTWLWDQWKIEVRHGWAMSEVIPGTLGQRIQSRADLFKSSEEQTKNVVVQGIFSPLLESKLVNPENMNEERKKDGIEVGELLVRGPIVTKMYFKNVKPENFIDGEWIKTGDICSISPKNVMKITDRSKDLIKSGGEWISSVDMENYTMQLEQVEMACVVAVSHPKWRERPVVIVKLFKNKKLSKKQVLKHIGTKFARFQVPDDVLFWDDIPLTSTGKLSKKTVRDMLKKQGYKLPSEQQIKTLKSKL